MYQKESFGVDHLLSERDSETVRERESGKREREWEEREWERENGRERKRVLKNI